MPNTRRNRSGRSNNRRPLRRARLVTKQELRNHEVGRLYTPPADPKTYVSCPWNQAISYNRVSPGSPGWGTFDLNSLKVGLRSQLGLPVNHAIDIKVVWINLHSYTDPTLAPGTYDRTFAVQFMNPISGCTLATSEDVGTATRFARIGYEWPKYVQNYPIKNVDNPTLFMHDIGLANTSAYFCQCRVLWRCSSYDPNPSYALKSEAVVKRNPVASVDPLDDLIEKFQSKGFDLCDDCLEDWRSPSTSTSLLLETGKAG